MVVAATSAGRSGLQDWIIQRVSAVVLAAYSIFMVCFFLRHPHLNFAGWQQLFSHNSMRVCTLLAIVALALHAWVGIWVVTTDYIKCQCARLCAQAIVVIGLLALVVSSVLVLWSVY